MRGRGWSHAGLVICGVIVVGSCAGGGTARPSNDASSAGAAGAGGTMTATGAAGLASDGGGLGGVGGTGGAGGSATGLGGNGAGGATGVVGGTAGADGGAGAAADPCGGALFCETFDGYAGVTSIMDKQKLGPWHASLETGATMGLDGLHTISGANALHVHIDNAATAGGRLFADGAQPLFATTPTHVYGRMMMYIDPNGTSNHWTFFGVNGNAEPSSPAVGRNASYLMSSLPKAGVNTYSFVYGLAAQGTDAYHDCSSQSATSMPSAWACVSFEMDSVARKLRMYKDGAPDPILSVDDHGRDCVAPTAVTSPWYGPSIAQLYVGAWSFHAMNAPLDVWIDDLVVDTKPVSCPPP
jgi:hypothetical protein